MTVPDTELWDAFRQGDRKSFGDLFCRYYPLLFQYGAKLCPDNNVLEDCIQELFLELWQNHSPSEVHSIKAYMLKALRYKIYKTYRRTGNHNMAEVPEDLAFVLSHESFLISRQEDQQRTERILAAIGQLPNREREIIYLRLYQKLTYEEIIEVMQISYQAGRNLFCRAIKSLREILA